MAHEVLILDDVDKRTDDGRQSSFAGETLFDVLRRLNYETRTTIITSNRDPVKLAKMFYQDDENRSALASRLAYQMETIYVGGHDRRKGDA